MILGLSVPAFTQLHVVISLLGIAAGLVVVGGLLGGRLLSGWNVAFLVTTILTSVTGFFFHSKAIGPPHVVGVISLVVLAVALLALYSYRLSGRWRIAYLVSSMLALYLNAFVGVVQTFQKITFFNGLAPNGNEPPFLLAQAIVLVFFVALGLTVLRRYMPRP